MSALRTILASATLLLTLPPALAEEPLFLRIRPQGSPPGAIGSGGPSSDEIAAARAAREAVWERSTQRANRAIASVCTGCLKDWPPARPARNDDTPVAAAPIPESAPEPAPAPAETITGDLAALSAIRAIAPSR